MDMLQAIAKPECQLILVISLLPLLLLPILCLLIANFRGELIIVIW